MLLNGKEQVHFWRELERVEQWLSTGAGAAAGRIYDSMGRPGEQAFANYGNQLVAAGARVERIREALDQSGPLAKRLVMQQLSGIGLSTVWDILVAACKEIALYYGGSVVAGAVVGGAVGSLAFGVGAAPGAVIGTAAGSQVGIWVLALLGLKELAEGLANMVPAAMAHYERGFREAWGAVPENRRETWNSPALPTGNHLAGAWQMAQGHVILVTAILTALVAYLTRGKGNKAVLMQDIRNSPRLGPRFADWLVENERRLIAQPQLQSRPNNTVAMAMEQSLPGSRQGAVAGRKSTAVAGARGHSSAVPSQLETFVAPSTGKSIQAAVSGNAIVPIDKVSVYARGGVADVSQELRALQQSKQNSRKVFDANPENAARLKKLKDMKHNFDRSQAMARELEQVGLTNTPENNKIIIDHLLEVGQSVTPENRAWVPSLLEGPKGSLEVKSTWKIMDDNRAYLNTLMFIPIE